VNLLFGFSQNKTQHKISFFQQRKTGRQPHYYNNIKTASLSSSGCRRRRKMILKSSSSLILLEKLLACKFLPPTATLKSPAENCKNAPNHLMMMILEKVLVLVNFFTTILKSPAENCKNPPSY
jgi:hypothetical protein